MRGGWGKRGNAGPCEGTQCGPELLLLTPAPVPRTRDVQILGIGIDEMVARGELDNLKAGPLYWCVEGAGVVEWLGGLVGWVGGWLGWVGG